MTGEGSYKPKYIYTEEVLDKKFTFNPTEQDDVSVLQKANDDLKEKKKQLMREVDKLKLKERSFNAKSFSNYPESFCMPKASPEALIEEIKKKQS